MNFQPGKFLKSSFAVAGATFASRLCGLLRVRLESAILGGGALASAWFLAFMIPNLFRRLLGEGALGTALVPLIAEIEEHDGIPEVRRKLATVLTALGTLLALIVVLFSLAALLSGQLIEWYGNADWRSDRYTMMLKLLPLLMPYAFFICLTGVIGAVLNYAKIFFLPALTARTVSPTPATKGTATSIISPTRPIQAPTSAGLQDTSIMLVPNEMMSNTVSQA